MLGCISVGGKDLLQDPSMMSDRSSYNQQENSDTEEDMYTAPFEYEVPTVSSSPEVPERPHVKPSKRMVHAPNGSVSPKGNDRRLLKVYTTLTHAHTPSIYSTPSQSMVFPGTNSAAEVEVDASQPHVSEEKVTLRSCSKIKTIILVCLAIAVAVAIISLIVSIIAVTASRPTEPEGCCDMREMVALQREVGELSAVVGRVRNRTGGYADLSSFYQSCMLETRVKRCAPEQGFAEPFSCTTDSLPSEKPVCTNTTTLQCVYHFGHSSLKFENHIPRYYSFHSFFSPPSLPACLPPSLQGYITLDHSCYTVVTPTAPVIATLHSDVEERNSMFCNCHMLQSNVVIDEDGAFELRCVMSALHCPIDQRLPVTLETV